MADTADTSDEANTMQLKALIWDVDGTLAETERDGHRVAFNRAFEALGLPQRWSEARYGELLHISGGRERLLHDMAQPGELSVPATDREALAAELHRRKNAHYAELMAGRTLTLRPGVAELIEEAAMRGLMQAIATTTSRANLAALLRLHFGASATACFSSMVCGEDVRHKKPDPEVYRRCLEQLNLGPLEAVAFEDSPGGAAAARAAGVPVVVTPSHYFAHQPFEGVLAIGPGLQTRCGWRPQAASAAASAAVGADQRVGLDQVLAWFENGETVSALP
jgi:HAD superfamily hydrolase (TIGR01509 family)